MCVREGKIGMKRKGDGRDPQRSLIFCPGNIRSIKFLAGVFRGYNLGCKKGSRRAGGEGA